MAENITIIFAILRKTITNYYRLYKHPHTRSFYICPDLASTTS